MTQKSLWFKRLIFVILAPVSIGVAANEIAAKDGVDAIRTSTNSVTGIIAQSTSETSEPQEKTSSSETDPAESKAEEKKETPAAPEKPFKKFRPSERIEAEQAVDFPYDI